MTDLSLNIFHMMAFAFMYTCVMYYIKLSIIHVDNWKDPLYSMHSTVMLCLFILLFTTFAEYGTQWEHRQ